MLGTNPAPVVEGELVAAAAKLVLAAEEAPPPDFRTNVAISHVVLAPVPAFAFGVTPAVAAGWSSARSSISDVFDTFTRDVQPEPAVSVSPKPESA
jgi:hypothetical protein